MRTDVLQVFLDRFLQSTERYAIIGEEFSHT